MWRRGAQLAVVAAIIVGAASSARSEYSPRMEPGRLAVRHASWMAAETCRASWPVATAPSVLLHVTLSRRGRVTAVTAEPDVPAFARCVRRELHAERFSVTGPDAEAATWVVVSRFVFPAE